MQSIKPDILPVLYLFGAILHCSNPNRNCQAAPCKSARVAAISTTFSSARLTGASLPVEPSLKRTGSQGVVKSEKLSISVFVIPPSCQSIPHSPNNHKRHNPSPQSPWQNPYPDAVAHTTYAGVRHLIFKLVFMFIPPALTYPQHAHLPGVFTAGIRGYDAIHDFRQPQRDRLFRQPR